MGHDICDDICIFLRKTPKSIVFIFVASIWEQRSAENESRVLFECPVSKVRNLCHNFLNLRIENEYVRVFKNSNCK